MSDHVADREVKTVVKDVNFFSNAASIISLFLGMPLFGKMLFAPILIGVGILSLLILIQLPFFLPVYAIQRARQRREAEMEAFRNTISGSD